MMSAVIRRRKIPELSDVAFNSQVTKLLQRVFISRGLTSDEDINLSLGGILSPDSMKGLSTAIEILWQSIQNNSRILIVGDYDADGATSCALAVRALQAFGHDNVQFLVPNRFEYGYGLTPAIVELAKHQCPDLIITVDNGIASVDGVAVAKKAGIRVIVTDHHLPGETLPAADAIVNPNQQGCHFPSKNLAGVGVIFYVMTALRTYLKKEGWFAGKFEIPNMAKFLDLVALGTVADVVPLDKNNRILVEQGLRRIRTGQCCVGIQSLIECSNRSAATLNASDFGFALGPRLNAAGRLDDISIGIACLLTDDINFAREIASELDGLNQDRRQIEQAMQLEAENYIKKIKNNLDIKNVGDGNTALPVGLCLYDENWHQGVVGILASRIKERYYRPVICFAPSTEKTDEDTIKGSARSIPGFHIRDALDRVATEYPELIDKFGGHAMAAGLSIKHEHLDKFTLAFDAVARQHLAENELQMEVLTDGELSVDDATVAMAAQLKIAMPWGQKLPEPIFDGVFNVIAQRIVGAKHLKLVLSRPSSHNTTIDAIAFNIQLNEWPDENVKQVRIAYLLDVNDFRGRQSVQFIVRHIEKVRGLSGDT